MPNYTLKERLKIILQGHKGRTQAVTGRELAFMFGLRDDRTIRLAIRELITEGLPIASATEEKKEGETILPAGYFLVTNWEETHQYAESIKGRLIADALRRRDFRRAAALYLKPGEQGRLI